MTRSKAFLVNRICLLKHADADEMMKKSVNELFDILIELEEEEDR